VGRGDTDQGVVESGSNVSDLQEELHQCLGANLSSEINGKQVRIPETRGQTRSRRVARARVECRWAFQFEFSFILITLFEAERRIVGFRYECDANVKISARSSFR